jgi:hypothetical protein
MIQIIATGDGDFLVRSPPLTVAAGPADHHIDLPAAAAGTDQPLAPIEHGRFGAVTGSHFYGIGST